jgi:Zn-dependent protease
VNLTPDLIAIGLIRYVVFLFSTTCHEAAHALAAKLGGDLTAFHSGQVSLNPVPHIRREPFGMVVVPLLALFTGGVMLGWASAPYDPYWRQRYPRRAAWMSLAGPAANFTLVLLAGILMHAGIAAGFLRAPEHLNSTHLVMSAAPGAGEAVALFLSVVFSLNLLLGVFNLIPLPPLDGFGAAELLMPPAAAAAWERFGATLRSYGFMLLLLCWQLFEHIYNPVFSLAIRMLYPMSLYQ